ncbi:clustered mitochondria protein [Cryptomeria japonica]|uniref:clustered mitochondria protein n=1 Tax=Cryptomeria japonica TaxID=3369 RepID=UPI0027DA73BE|nr:clustered mitochondria protein [Cryptomeria japonica]
MAGRSNKSKNKGRGGMHSKNATQNNPILDVGPASNEISSGKEQIVDHSGQNSDVSKDPNSVVNGPEHAEKGSPHKDPHISENGNETDSSSTVKHGNGDLRLYPVTVKGPCGEKLELQINPGDSVMDLRQFLLDAPETCFYTCYDLIMVMKDGSHHQLADYFEIGDVGDITTGGCSLEMVTASYDDRSVRSHVRRVRDLISISTLHSSLSTTFAMEYEATRSTSGGDRKSEVPELEGLGFMEDPNGLLENLVVSPSSQEIKCVESIAFSSFNPAPGYRRLLGDLIYLDVVTLEGQSFCITAHTRGFYINASTGDILDPRPAKSAHETTSIVNLLRQISNKFKKGFREVLDRKASCHPFENVPSLLPLHSWLGVSPPPAHRRDVSRAEDALALPYGTESIGMQRDWNEELQSCREFPRKTIQDRILRDRALYKVSCDFVDAAIKGAKGVISRCIPPINPTDPERFHMYVHNNIFFSFAVDADFTQMQQSYEQKTSLDNARALGNDEGNRCDALEDQKDVNNVESPKGDTLSNQNVSDVIVDEVKEPEKEETGVEGLDAKEETEPDVALLETDTSQLIDSEQATYASANNDLKGTKAYNNADISGLYTLAMAIVDYRGHRVVAQSIIPGILQGDKSDSLLYGSVDNGKKICWNDKFHEKVLEAAKVLHIKEHEVLDGSGNRVKMAAPVECKGIVGSDDRHYLLDLMRTTPRDANYMGPGSRYCVLRPELVASFCQVESQERAKKNNQKDATNGSSLQEDGTAVLLNPNILTDFKLAGDSEEIASDESLVKKAGAYLVDVVLPKFVQDLSSLEVSPMDGQTLTEALHAHGINIRYIGKVANMAKPLPHIVDLCIVEMVVRAAKHVLKGVLRETQDHDLGGAIAHFFNCFLGHDAPTSTKVGSLAGDKPRKKGKGGHSKKAANQLPSTSDNTSKSIVEACKKHSKILLQSKNAGQIQSSYLCITSELVWIDIKECVKFKYQFELPEDVKIRVKKMSTFRNLCQKVGITIGARKHDLDSETPFKISDILDMHTVVKHSATVCSDARDLIETGKLQLAEGKLNEAYELFSEAFAILQQVSGPMHREVANCCRYLAMVLYHAGDMAGAIMQQHKELIINERCLGLDHPDTAHSYGNMALFYHGLNQTELALRHMARTLLLLNVSCGPDHPDVAATFINIAMMYQDIGRMNIALRYLQEALKKNERLLGHDHIQTAVCYHALAIAFNCMGAYKLSLQHERSTYNILAKQLGEDDSRTRDSANWIKTFQIRDLQINAQKQKGQAVDLDATQKAVDALKARPELLQAFQAATGGPTAARSRTSLNKAATAVLMSDTLPRGRGMDERGARAAAEVRKKAVARGLNVRSQGVTTQSLPQLTDLLNIINSSVASKSPPSDSPSTSTQEVGNESTTNSENGIKTAEVCVEETRENVSEENLEDKTPLGLGTGLTSLDNKKQKSKPKTSSD